MTATATLPRVEVPDEAVYVPRLGAVMYTGEEARRAVRELPAGTDVAIDIETPSVTDSFSIKCVTAAWVAGGETHTVLLDPLRRMDDHAAVRTVVSRARWLILHGAPFDIPGLVAAGLMTLDNIGKVMDTLVLARAAWPDTLEKKSLEALAGRMLGLRNLDGAIKVAQKASGYTTAARWFAEGDIGIPVYRMGAMADTVVTLRLAHPLFEAAVDRQLDHPFTTYGLTDRGEAAALVLRAQQNNRIALRRAARGLRVDLDYLDGYVDTVAAQREAATAEVTGYGCRPGNGADIIKYLSEQGYLPSNWPRTEKGTLKADKTNMEKLEHPLAVAHRQIAHTKKVLGYMEKVRDRARFTGRLHPQFHILGASATGRMSASEPELQQFPEEARPILLADEGSPGMQSVDWSSIEPALMAWLARDEGFIGPFEAGEDLYAPVQAMCGISRKMAKVVVLAAMYGQGKTKLAGNLRVSVEEAQAIQSRMFQAMPESRKFMRQTVAVADQYGLTVTVSGRILTIPRFNGVPAGYKAVNYRIQGSGADLMYEAAIELDRRGLADYIYLMMHDEIVGDAEAAREIQEVMATAPARLIQAAGRVPVIRTDSQFLGPAWKAC